MLKSVSLNQPVGNPQFVIILLSVISIVGFGLAGNSFTGNSEIGEKKWITNVKKLKKNYTALVCSQNESGLQSKHYAITMKWDASPRFIDPDNGYRYYGSVN